MRPVIYNNNNNDENVIRFALDTGDGDLNLMVVDEDGDTIARVLYINASGKLCLCDSVRVKGIDTDKNGCIKIEN